MSNKQEEIKEAMKPVLEKLYWQGRKNANLPIDGIGVYPEIDEMFKELDRLGVVIKVDCPKCRGFARPNKVTYNLYTGYTVDGHSCPNCNNTGYEATEPLIKEK